LRDLYTRYLSLFLSYAHIHMRTHTHRLTNHTFSLDPTLLFLVYNFDLFITRVCTRVWCVCACAHILNAYVYVHVVRVCVCTQKYLHDCLPAQLRFYAHLSKSTMDYINTTMLHVLSRVKIVTSTVLSFSFSLSHNTHTHECSLSLISFCPSLSHYSLSVTLYFLYISHVLL